MDSRYGTRAGPAAIYLQLPLLTAGNPGFPPVLDPFRLASEVVRPDDSHIGGARDHTHCGLDQGACPLYDQAN
jgi:hypothetical protein